MLSFQNNLLNSMKITFETVAANLTSASGNLVDFFNIGGLFKQRSRETNMGLWHHYSWREYLARGSIIVATAAFGWATANTCQDENCSTLVRGAGGAAFGFFASHVVVMGPTLIRRQKIKSETVKIRHNVDQSLANIETMFNSESILFEYAVKLIVIVKKTVDEALHLKLPVTKRGDAVKNLITIKNLMRKIDAKLKNLEEELGRKPMEEMRGILDNASQSWAQDFKEMKRELRIETEENSMNLSDNIGVTR